MSPSHVTMLSSVKSLDFYRKPSLASLVTYDCIWFIIVVTLYVFIVTSHVVSLLKKV